jgi:hypothetical protein
MGAANCKVHNDTEEKIEVYAFSYSDGIRLAATTRHILSPDQTKEFKAGADFRGNFFWVLPRFKLGKPGASKDMVLLAYIRFCTIWNFKNLQYKNFVQL